MMSVIIIFIVHEIYYEGCIIYVTEMYRFDVCIWCDLKLIINWLWMIYYISMRNFTHIFLSSRKIKALALMLQP